MARILLIDKIILSQGTRVCIDSVSKENNKEKLVILQLATNFMFRNDPYTHCCPIKCLGLIASWHIMPNVKSGNWKAMTCYLHSKYLLTLHVHV